MNRRRAMPRRQGSRSFAEDLGWQHRETTNGTVYTGFFRVHSLAFPGWIRHDRTGKLHFLIHQPPMELLRETEYFGCFHPRGDGWQLVTFKPHEEPPDPHSGIASIQKALLDAVSLRMKKRCGGNVW